MISTPPPQKKKKKNLILLLINLDSCGQDTFQDHRFVVGSGWCLGLGALLKQQVGLLM